MKHSKIILDIDVDRDFCVVKVTNAEDGLQLFSGTLQQFRFWLDDVRHIY